MFLKIKINLIFHLLFLLASLGYSQQPPAKALNFKHLNINDGLSQNAVYALAQDHSGFIWIGTKDGLNRYDGYNFTIYKHNPADSHSISNNSITDLFVDSRGILWVGTLEKGLNRFDRINGTFERFEHNPSQPNSISSDRIEEIKEDSQGNLWIGTYDGLNMIPSKAITSDSVSFISFKVEGTIQNGFSPNNIISMREDAKNVFWIGTAKGLYKLNLKSDYKTNSKFEHFPIKLPYPMEPLDKAVYSLLLDRKNILWAGLATGLVKIDQETGAYTYYPHKYKAFRKGWGAIVEMTEDESGNLWIATPTELMVFNPSEISWTSYLHDPLNPESLSSNGLTKILRDRSGIIWISSNGFGVNIYDPRMNRFPTFRPAPDFQTRHKRFSIYSIFEDKDKTLWINGDGLYKWERETGVFKSFETDPYHPQDFGNTGGWSTIQDSSGYIWVAGHEGLYRYGPKKQTVKHYTVKNGLKEKVTYQVFLENQHTIWIASENYFSKLNINTGAFTHYRYRQNPRRRYVPITHIIKGKQGFFWLATDDGLVRFNPEKEQFKYYRHIPNKINSLSNNIVLSITADPLSDSILWLGTAGGGLNRFDYKANSFSSFNEEDGLPNDVVYAALPDKNGNLWLSTNKGISCFNPKEKSFRNYDIRDGLQSNEFNTSASFLSKSGEMFFGGIKGINYFYPDKIIDNPYKPNVVITGMRLFNRSISHKSHPEILDSLITSKKEINLSYLENVFSFNFSALDYSSPDRNQYAYRMIGFNDEWIPSGTERNATYTNLPAGEYIFQVKGSNNDGVWNEEGTRIRIIITPPIWKTWWAYAFYLIVFLALLFYIRKYEMNRLQLKSRLQVEQVEADGLRQLDQMRSQFFANISHEFRTPLTLILGPLENLYDKVKNEQLKLSIKTMQRNAGHLLKLINQLLDLSKLDAGKMSLDIHKNDIIPVVRGTIMAYKSLAEMKNIHLEFSTEYKKLIADFDNEKIETIINNLLSNAFKFTPTDGEIKVAITVSLQKENRLLIKISDSGSGISEDQQKNIFNRFYQVDGSSKRMQDGTGIGLALVKELVELHGGNVDVQSKPNSGATFSIALPILKEDLKKSEKYESLNKVQIDALNESAEELDTQQEPDIIEQPSPTPKEVKDSLPIVLVVEDNNDVRAYIHEHLQHNFNVVEANDGQVGVKAAIEIIPDLIISDLMMPKMDGYGLCKKLKTDMRTSHIPIILLTARAGSEDKIEGLETGADDYLIKPFNFKELIVRVKNLIDNRRKLRERFSKQTELKPAEISVNSADEVFLKKVLASIENNLANEKFNLESLSKDTAMSERQLQRKIKALTDQSPKQFIRTMRLQRANELLTKNAATISEIAYMCGFGSVSYFTRCFREQFGITPSSVTGNASGRKNQ